MINGIVDKDGMPLKPTPEEIAKRVITAGEMDMFVKEINGALMSMQRGLSSLGIRLETLSQIAFDAEPKIKFNFEDTVLELNHENFETVVKRVVAEMQAKVKEIEEREKAKQDPK